MTRSLARWTLLVGVASLAAACGNERSEHPGAVDCSSVDPTTCAAGQFVILDAAETGLRADSRRPRRRRRSTSTWPCLRTAP